jgi:hypothetical protein
VTSWHRKLRVDRIEASRPLTVISVFENGGSRNIEEGEVLEFPFETTYRYCGEKDGRSVLLIDAEIPPGRD